MNAKEDETGSQRYQKGLNSGADLALSTTDIAIDNAREIEIGHAERDIGLGAGAAVNQDAS